MSRLCGFRKTLNQFSSQTWEPCHWLSSKRFCPCRLTCGKRYSSVLGLRSARSGSESRQDRVQAGQESNRGRAEARDRDFWCRPEVRRMAPGDHVRRRYVTIKKAERLTGYEIRELPSERGKVTLGAFDGSRLVVKTSGRVEWLALKSLVDRVYLLHSRITLERHDWCCARCKSRRPLQIHHRKFRSHGGTHQVENLEPVCWDCHRVIHECERSV